MTSLKTESLVDKQTDDALDAIGDAMAEVSQGALPQRLCDGLMLRYQRLMQDVSNGSISHVEFQERFLEAQDKEKNVKRTRKSTDRKICEGYLGKVTKSKEPAMLVEVNSQSVVFDKWHHSVGSRPTTGYGTYIRARHSKFLEKLKDGKIRFMTDEEYFRWNLEKTNIEMSSWITQIESEKSMYDLLDHLSRSSEIWQIPLMPDETIAHAAKRIVTILRKCVGDNQLYLDRE